MTTLTYIMIAIGIFVLVTTFFETKKLKKITDDLVRTNKCKGISYYKKPMIFLTLMIIPCMIAAYLGYQSKNETTLNLGILLCFLFLSEGYRAYFTLRIYYNDKGIISNSQFIRIKSIKTYYKNTSFLPFSKWTFLTYNGEKIILISKLADFVLETYKNELPIVKTK